MNAAAKAYALTRVLDTPFWGIFNLLPFILYKDLHASVFEISLLITLKPLTSLFSSYYTHYMARKSEGLGRVLASTRRWAFLPFLFFPCVDSVPFVIGSFALFMFFQTAMMPIWMELLGQQVEKEQRESLFSYTQAFGYLGGGVLPFLLGWMLDEWEGAWRFVFAATAAVGLLAEYGLRKVQECEPRKIIASAAHPLIRPWKEAWQLLRERKDYARFQLNFMLLGSGLMIIQPALPVFFVDHLHLSYTEMGVAITLCKGIGFALASPLWLRGMKGGNLFALGSSISLLAALFPFLLFAAESFPFALYIAYLTYGWMQSGNEFSWNMSGPIFSGQQNSAPYSSINVTAVGLRGLFVPFLGALILGACGSLAVMAISALLCVTAAYAMMVTPMAYQVE